MKASALSIVTQCAPGKHYHNNNMSQYGLRNDEWPERWQNQNENKDAVHQGIALKQRWQNQNENQDAVDQGKAVNQNQWYTMNLRSVLGNAVDQGNVVKQGNAVN
ncbi:uncharacterized protein C8R40DRAFT_1073520 [Lentinula edodes]|uniref:uncharacterized protein n=1 Tax=Lentinula edodes TaxID=5353 RepID=UPI001E8D4E14|nr:uncharacterized protein C8R40DRAFT_1073520 [Lentinula edodes]KAH7870057.1 hypothetical protein C8R40DRAFT_1073520 [Lentinula edodes]